jgi:glutathione synthase
MNMLARQRECHIAERALQKGDDRQLLQVEINTISSSFGSLSTRISEMFRALNSCEESMRGTVPVNKALYEIADAIAGAHREYLRQTGDPEAVVLMVVQPDEHNLADQRLVQFQLLEAYGITTRRATLEELCGGAELADDFTLNVREDEVSVVYYRAGYTPVRLS